MSQYLQQVQKEYLRGVLSKMLDFLLNSMGKYSQEEVQKKRSLFEHNPILVQIYDKLVIKYFSAKRGREDIVRYILRKAFKISRDRVIKWRHMNERSAGAFLCTKYFKKDIEKLQKDGRQFKGEDDILEFFMPYGAKSRNKTMNTEFIADLFKSQEFCEDYKYFLTKFDDCLEEDNRCKKSKLIEFIINCINFKCLHKITNYPRFPWLELWSSEAKSLAKLLLEDQQLVRTYKRQKK